MAIQYANEQPQGFKNFIANVAVIGAGGQVGGFITRELIAQGKHQVTAITRPESKNELPQGLHVVRKVNYDDHASLVEVLKDQEVLIITMSVMAPRDSQKKLIDAAVDAGVKYIMPNEFGSDVSDEKFADETRHGAASRAMRLYIEQRAAGTRTKWVSLACGFWYEFSLSGTEVRYGFDFEKKSVTLFSDGRSRTCTSTFPMCGRAVARLFALPLLPTSSDSTHPHLTQWDNKPLFIASFVLSQRDMLASVLRVTGDKESDWTITHEPVEARFQRGVKMLEEGNMIGFGILLYSRVFFPEEPGNFEKRLQNGLLGLEQEDLDEWTKVAVNMVPRGLRI